MKTSRLLGFAFFVAFVCTVLVPAFGGSKTGSSIYKPKNVPPPPQMVIASVTANAMTVSQDKVTKTYAVTQFTEINVNGQRATIADLKPGMTVSVTSGTDPSKASRIVATGK
jgi:hypothetical protein